MPRLIGRLPTPGRRSPDRSRGALAISVPPKPLGFQFAYPGRVYRSGPALIDARRFRRRNAFELALLPQVRLELHEDAEHIQEAFAGRGAGVDRLLGRRPSP
jgi:hypothetical protein